MDYDGVEGGFIAGRELSVLIPTTEYIMQWMRDESPMYAAEYLIPRYGSFSNSALEAVDALIQAFEKSLNGEYPTSKLRYILSCYDIDVWGEAVRMIICTSDPPLVSAALQKEIMSFSTSFVQYADPNSGDNTDDLMKELVPLIDNLPVKAFKTLGNLCALIRDCSKDPDNLSRGVGINLFLSLQDFNDKNNVDACAYVFRLMVADCERIFGQPSTRSLNSSFGIRNTARKFLYDPSKVKGKNYQLVVELETFYSKVDPKFKEIAEYMFKFHSFIDIAHAIYLKYSVIPSPWREHLQKQKLQGERLDWFNHESIRTIDTPGVKLNINRQAFLFGGMRLPLDDLVDEFIDMERGFYRQMLALGIYFVRDLKAIAEGRLGDGAQKALGLNYNEVKALYGTRLQNIVDFSHKLATKLEPIHLLRTPLKGNYTRAVVLCNILQSFLREEDNMMWKAYWDFSSSYNECVSLLTLKMKQKRHRDDFRDLWESCRHKIPSMQGAKLEETMQIPTSQMKNYARILTDIAAQMDRNSQDYMRVYDTLGKLNATAQQLTDLSMQGILSAVGMGMI